MIANKNQLKKRLKENKDSLIFETIKNTVTPTLVGVQRKANIVQTNAFTLLTTKDNGKVVDSWIYYNSCIEVKNNMINFMDSQGNITIQIKIIEI